MTQATNSDLLERAADALVDEDSGLRQTIAGYGRRWDGLGPTGFGGAAATAATTMLHRTTGGLDPVGTEMLAVAGLLRANAEVQRGVEKLLERAEDAAFAAALAGWDDNPAEAVVHQLRALGDGLDWACAQGIDALCTPELAEPPRRLDELETLPAAAVHEVMLAQAPPEVQRLAAENPDLVLLETGDGHLVAAIGDIDSADEIATYVAGVGSSRVESWPTQVSNARSLAQATGGAAVLWLGYNAPESLPHATHAGPARHGGQALARFQAELARRNPHAHKTVVGFSYGSVVAGHAAAGGLHADDLVLVGSPGAGPGVTSASDYQLRSDSPRVFATSGAADVIRFATGPVGGVHGVDPTSPGFGAQPWPTEYFSNHTDYWRNPEFLAGFERLHPER